MRGAQVPIGTFLLGEMGRGEKGAPLMRLTRLHQLTLALVSCSTAAILALSSAAVAFAGGGGTNFP
jgi:hypothetical protein